MSSQILWNVDIHLKYKDEQQVQKPSECEYDLELIMYCKDCGYKKKELIGATKTSSIKLKLRKMERERIALITAKCPACSLIWCTKCLMRTDKEHRCGSCTLNYFCQSCWVSEDCSGLCVYCEKYNE